MCIRLGDDDSDVSDDDGDNDSDASDACMYAWEVGRVKRPLMPTCVNTCVYTFRRRRQ